MNEEQEKRIRAQEREKVAAWMILNSFATGHGDTIEDMLVELGGQVKELRARAQARD